MAPQMPGPRMPILTISPSVISDKNLTQTLALPAFDVKGCAWVRVN